MTAYNIINIYFFIMLILIVYWAANIKSLNRTNYSNCLLCLGLFICIYIFGYAMELNSESVPQILFWNNFEYFGIPYVSAFWLLVALIYTGHFNRYKKILCFCIFTIPVVTMVLRLTNEYHHFYFLYEYFIINSNKLIFVKTFGPWMFVQAIHSMLMIIAALILFTHDFIKNKEKTIGKTVLIIASSVFGGSGLVFSYLKPFGYIIDYMVVCLPLACLMVVIAIMQFDFLETKSFARSKAFESNRDAILLMNSHKKIIDFNKNAKQLFLKLNIELSEGYADKIFRDEPDLLEELNNNDSTIIKLRVGSEERYFEINTNSIDGNNPSRGYIKTICDVTSAHELNKSLKMLAMMDELSGLSNRRAFIQSGEKMMLQSEQEGKSIHLLMMDLDYFKRINDRYGHQTGDEVINYIGNELKHIFNLNSLIARLGGEEFAVLLSGFSDNNVKDMTYILMKKISAHEHRHKEEVFHVTLSIGFVKKSSPEQTLHNLMHMADKALYKSKDRGRNCATDFNEIARFQ